MPICGYLAVQFSQNLNVNRDLIFNLTSVGCFCRLFVCVWLAVETEAGRISIGSLTKRVESEKGARTSQRNETENTVNFSLFLSWISGQSADLQWTPNTDVKESRDT